MSNCPSPGRVEGVVDGRALRAELPFQAGWVPEGGWVAHQLSGGGLMLVTRHEGQRPGVLVLPESSGEREVLCLGPGTYGSPMHVDWVERAGTRPGEPVSGTLSFAPCP